MGGVNQGRFLKEAGLGLCLSGGEEEWGGITGWGFGE